MNVKLLTNVNTNRVLSHVLDTIYKSPDLYFKEKDEKGKRYEIPSRSNFRIFIQNVLFNQKPKTSNLFKPFNSNLFNSKLLCNSKL